MFWLLKTKEESQISQELGEKRNGPNNVKKYNWAFTNQDNMINLQSLFFDTSTTLTNEYQRLYTQTRTKTESR